MDTSTLLLISALFYAIYYYFKKKLSFFEKHGIPHKPGLPLIGNNLRNILKKQHVIELLNEIYNINPEAKYVGWFDLNRSVIVLRDIELVKAVGIKHFDSFSDRANLLDETVDPLFGGSLFTMAGGKWKETRNLLSPAFTGSKMKAMYELMVTCAETFVDYLDKVDSQELRMVDSKDLFTKYTTDVIASCAFGIKVDSLSDPNNDFYVLGKDAVNFEKISLAKILLLNFSPTLMKLLKIKLFDEKVVNFFKNVVKTTIETRDKTGVSRPDMIQLMLDARSKEHQHLKLDIMEMTAQAFIFFFGGFDSTSNQLCVIAHELANNQKVQEKLQEEIDKYLEKAEGKVTYEAINEMPYLDAVVNESLRRHAQFGFIERQCKKEFELPPTLPGTKPFILKPGMIVRLPGASIHMDPKYYENPEVFDPDRFYLKKKVSVNEPTYLSFGIGPRACIAYRFALLEIKVLFFLILSKYNFKPNEKTNKMSEYDKKSFLPRPIGGFWLSIEPRN